MTSNAAAPATTIGNAEVPGTHSVVVIGGTGLIGSKLVAMLREHGHGAIAASPNTGVDTLTGRGLSEVLRGATVVVDVSNSPSFDDAAVMDFFTKSTRNLLAAEADAGVRHHVALSVVGTERLQEIGYFRAKQAQEQLIDASSIPSTIIRATQFFEFIMGIAAGATDGTRVRLAPVRFQPIAADDVTAALARAAAGPPLRGRLEIAGPERSRLDEFVQSALSAQHDTRVVIADPTATYFGARLSERTLIPGDGASLGATTFKEWLGRQPSRKQP